MWNYLLIISQNLKYEKHKDKILYKCFIFEIY